MEETFCNVTSSNDFIDTFILQAVENLSWSILEQFSKVTQLAKTPTRFVQHQIQSHLLLGLPATQLPIAESRKPEEHYQQGHSTSLGTFEMLEDEDEEPLPVVERAKEMSPEEWINMFDSSGRITDEDALRKRIFNGVGWDMICLIVLGS